MGARAPALFRKPAGKGGRKQGTGFGIDLVHALKLVKRRGKRRAAKACRAKVCRGFAITTCVKTKT
jgi:hypothetical protein